jgi:hypothetical protein
MGHSQPSLHAASLTSIQNLISPVVNAARYWSMTSRPRLCDFENILVNTLQRRTVDRFMMRDPISQNPDILKASMNVFAAAIAAVRKRVLQTWLP